MTNLPDTMSADVEHEVAGRTERFPKLSYVDRHDLLDAARVRHRDGVLADAKAAGLDPDATYAALRETDALYRAAGAFVWWLENGDGAVPATLARVLRKRDPSLTAEGAATLAEAYGPDALDVVMRACNLRRREPPAGGEDGEGSDPRTPPGETSTPPAGGTSDGKSA